MFKGFMIGLGLAFGLTIGSIVMVVGVSALGIMGINSLIDGSEAELEDEAKTVTSPKASSQKPAAKATTAASITKPATSPAAKHKLPSSSKSALRLAQ